MDTELMISEVSMRPVLWDMSCEEYKNKNKKSDAWVEVCCAIVEDFSLQSEAEKKITVSNIIAKWRAVRDNYIRYLRKQEDSFKSGSAAKNITQYIYHEQLSFLQKTKEKRKTSNNLMNDGLDSDDFQATLMDEDSPTTSDVPTTAIKSYKTKIRNIPSNEGIEKKLIEFMDTHKNRIQPPPSPAPVEDDDDLLFFRSLLPSVKALRQDQKFEFRINVMKMLQEIPQTSRPPVRPPVFRQPDPQSTRSYFSNFSVDDDESPKEYTVL